ncbi:MAG: hypothetical protein ACJAQS_001541 [Porticoccus sp.]|jgi:hypothetical protein
MKSAGIFAMLIFAISFNTLAAEQVLDIPASEVKQIAWADGMNVETFWLNYAKSKGGQSWGKSISYPEYEKVKAGDTILIQLKQGSCLMEFFHNRWRRANDVKRWNDTMNEYGGCPYVFN